MQNLILNPGKILLLVMVSLLLAACGGGSSSDDDDETPAVSADAGTGRALVPGSTIVLDASGSRSNNGAISYQWRQLSGPDVGLTGTDQRRIELFAPNFGGDETLVFEVLVSAGGLTDTDQVTFVVSLTAANGTPVADAGPDQQVDADAVVNLDGSGSFDPDSAALTYAWIQTGGYAVTLAPDAQDVGPTFTTPRLPYEDILTFELRASDGFDTSPPDIVTVTVNDAASGPYDLAANTGPDFAVTEGDPVILRAAGFDAPTPPGVDFLWECIRTDDSIDRCNFEGPAPVFSGADTAEVSFTAPGTTTGDFDRTLWIQLTITAGSETVTDVVEVEVWPVDNTAPVLFSTVPDFTFTADGVPFQPTIVVRFIEAGGLDPSTITTSSFFLTDDLGAVIPADVSVNDTREIELTPTVLLDSLEYYAVNLTSDITDRSGNAFAGFSWFFRVQADLPPVSVDVGASPRFVDVGETVELIGTAVDNEQPSNTLSYQWTSDKGSVIVNADQANASFTPGDIIGDRFTLTVTDRAGNTNSDSVYVTALEDRGNAVFAASCACPDNGDDADLGSWDAPVETIARALELAGSGATAKDIYLRGGFAPPATISLPDGVSLYGGFINNSLGWTRTDGGLTFVTVSAPIGLLARDIDLAGEISQLRIISASGASNASGPGGSSVAVLIDSGTPAALTLRNNLLLANRGGSATGTPPTPSTAGSGSPGSHGDDGGNDAFAQSIGFGGNGGAGCDGAHGGDGGDGGNGAEGGANGGNGRYRPKSGGGTTTANNRGFGGSTEGNGTSGNGGIQDPGIGGFAIQGTALDGSGFPVSISGGVGEHGGGGIGGGGGGGGGGAGGSFFNAVKDSGGGGGGGGGGGCGGSGGSGGYGGGGSFGVYLVNADANIIANDIRTSDGGAGGTGGTGGRGGGGGSGGNRGDDGGEPGGNGGDGGTGGAGSGGGGGAGGPGGPSVGIYRHRGVATLADTTNFQGNLFTIGDGGDGGSSGAGGRAGCCGYVFADQQRGLDGADGATGRSASVY